MVDNKGVSPITTYFKSGDASGMANKMSEEKYGQGGEYFVFDNEEEQQAPQREFQDRSAQLRASLNGLAAQNVGSMEFMKKVKEKENKAKKRKDILNFEEIYQEGPEEEFGEEYFSD